MEVDITEKVKKVMKFGPIALVVIAILCAGGVWAYQHSQKGLTVYDAKVASTMVGVKAKADGTITELVVQDGDHVEAGDVIAHVQAKVTDEDIAQLEQNAALAKQSLEQVQKGQTITMPQSSAVPVPTPAPVQSSGNSQAVANARARLNRMNELFEMGAVSAKQRDQAAADLEAAEASASTPAPVVSAPTPSVAPRTMTQAPNPEAVKQAELAVKQAEAALENAKQDAQTTDIVAPVAGTVYYAENALEGSDLKAGDNVASIGDDTDIWVEAKLSPNQKSSIRLGQFVSYTIDGRKYQGTVTDIKDPADTANMMDSAESTSSDATDGTSADGSSTSESSGDSTTQKSAPTATEGSADTDDGRITVKISLPKDDASTLRPGMEAVVKFALNK
ncbi:HlyD family efflux transporter periplasmic adaptor subunit [uncultured Selenomonas sp.]|uniref:HlyD family secretion protein n=1 Tax=uncultured Selenomonas sp. TaxID=159275 RepID=UPI0025F2F525|nr:HlyD family efflux transporter periplasmic adaptor subunit [uncultured Selenomonas sp.]